MYKQIIHETSKIMPGAQVYGNVTVGENVGVWFNASLRADKNKIVIGKDSNIQDGCVLHGKEDVIIGERVSIGHGAILHGCSISDDVLIGMGCIIMDGVHIGKNCIIAAGTLLTEGTQIPENSLVMGSPGKVKREMTAEDSKSIIENAEMYVELAKGFDERYCY